MLFIMVLVVLKLTISIKRIREDDNAEEVMNLQKSSVLRTLSEKKKKE